MCSKFDYCPERHSITTVTSVVVRGVQSNSGVDAGIRKGMFAFVASVDVGI